MACLAALAGVVHLRRTANRAPVLAQPAVLRVTVGERLDVPLVAADPDGDAVAWSAAGLPAGATLDGTGRLVWSPGPDQAGTYRARVSVRDGDGASAGVSVELRARHPARPGLYVAMGDSVASGHGLDLRDWLGGDACWRDGEASYPARVLERRVAAPTPGEPALRTLALVACSGSSSDDLVTQPVSGGPALPGAPGAPSRPQLDWAVVSNPTLVTVTVGANDVGVGDPGRVVGPGGRIDRAGLDARREGLERNLTRVLRRLVDATDARVIVSTYHNPTARDPEGVPGCRRDCFARAAAAVVSLLNDTLRTAAAAMPSGRVMVADVAGAFVGHGAPNGRGPDVLRRGTPIPLPAPLDDTTAIQPYCAEGRAGTAGAWVSAADCIHPNRQGARAYAAAVDRAWRGGDWRPG